MILLYYEIVLSAITFLVYAYDKNAARQGRWRISERTLLLLSASGGCWGALAAMQLLRHKTRKLRFWFVGLAAAAVYLGLLWFVGGVRI